jgi:hypothetical protein
LGLGSSYKSIRSYILLSTDLPAFKTVVVMIQREETRRCGMAGSQAKNSEEHEVQALSVKHSKPPLKKFKTLDREREIGGRGKMQLLQEIGSHRG